jgi:acetoacetate decarboxylase
MAIRGKLAQEDFGRGMPVDRSPYDYEVPTLDSTSLLSFTYRTDGESAAELLPDVFELEDSPVASLWFVSYGLSNVGRYREVVHAIQVTLDGEQHMYIPHIYVTNDEAMIAGREVLGFPKLIAGIDWDPTKNDHNSLLSANLERPTASRAK